MKLFFKSFPLFTLSAAVLFGSTACLKTRAQIRDEAETERRQASKVEIMEVESKKNAQAFDELNQELQTLQNRVSELERANSQNLQRMEIKYDQMKQEWEQKLQATQEAHNQLIENLSKKEKEPEVVVPKKDPLDVFAAGQAAFAKKDSNEAITKMDAYLKFPKGKKREDALFLRGESYFINKDYKKAILDFSAIQEKFPKSKRMPNALLRTGQCFEALSLKSDAQAFYQELIERFPKSPEAKRAGKSIKHP